MGTSVFIMVGSVGASILITEYAIKKASTRMATNEQKAP